MGKQISNGVGKKYIWPVMLVYLILTRRQRQKQAYMDEQIGIILATHRKWKDIKKKKKGNKTQGAFCQIKCFQFQKLYFFLLSLIYTWVIPYILKQNVIVLNSLKKICERIWEISCHKTAHSYSSFISSCCHVLWKCCSAETMDLSKELVQWFFQARTRLGLGPTESNCLCSPWPGLWKSWLPLMKWHKRQLS